MAEEEGKLLRVENNVYKYLDKFPSQILLISFLVLIWSCWKSGGEREREEANTYLVNDWAYCAIQTGF